MKRIGLLGGMSWESSIEHYRFVNEKVRERLGGLQSADCLLRGASRRTKPSLLLGAPKVTVWLHRQWVRPWLEGVGMLRSFLLALIASCGVLSGAAVGGLQIGPIDTVTSVVSSVTAQTTVVSEATDAATGAAGGGSGATDSGATDSGATDALSGGAQALAGGSSGVRPGKTFHSRFDPLPRRYELLLERLELGRSPRAARARLLALLASATPELRERVVRLIRMEIRRLERGGLTARERPAAQALRQLLRRLDRQVSGETVGAARSPGPPADADTGAAGARGAGVASTRAGSESRRADPARSRAGSRGEAGGGTPWGPLPSPIPPSSPLDWLLLLVLLLGGIGCLLLLLSLVPRRSVPSRAQGAVAARRHELRILALTVVLTGVVGLGVVVLLA